MTTATTELFASHVARPANAISPLLSVLAVILGVNLRESLSAQSNSQDDAGYTWGL